MFQVSQNTNTRNGIAIGDCRVDVADAQDIHLDRMAERALRIFDIEAVNRFKHFALIVKKRKAALLHITKPFHACVVAQKPLVTL